jgi:hypothetical protein
MSKKFGATPDSEYSFSDTSYLAIPHALMKYNSTMLYNSYLILEGQLSQIDCTVDPLMYEEIERLTQAVFDCWVSLGYREGEADGVRV